MSHITDPIWHGLMALCHTSQASHGLFVGKNGVTRDGKSEQQGIFERVGVGKRARVAQQYIHVLILGKRKEEWKGN